MKIIEKKKINETRFKNSASSIAKFFKEIDYASSALVLGGPTGTTIDDSLIELSKLFGRYIGQSQKTLIDDFDGVVTIKPQKLAQLFLDGFNSI